MYKNNQIINLFQKNTEEVMMVFKIDLLLDKWCHWDKKKITKQNKKIKNKKNKYIFFKLKKFIILMHQVILFSCLRVEYT